MSEENKQELNHVIHTISDDISDIVIREQQVMDSELSRMSNLLKESARNLRECFSAMSNELAQQAAQLRERNPSFNRRSTDKDLQNLLSSTNEISSHVGIAVRALQFEDILQQLIGHTRIRATEIEKLFTSIHTQIEHLHHPDEQAEEEIMKTLQDLQHMIALAKEALQLSNPVSQESMDKGDVELF